MIVLRNADAMLALGVAIGCELTLGDVVTLSGPLGVGKTVLARGILRSLGFAGDVPSPSFPLVISYDPPDVRLPLAHVDLYRIDDVDRIAELALDEARAHGAIVIEWPERLGAMRWHDTLDLVFHVQADGARALTAQVPPAWEQRWPPT